VVLPRSETALKDAVANIGPVAVGIYGETRAFRQYGGGIYDNPRCRKGFYVNHAVLVVGYGSENGKDYWIIKNR